MTYRATIIGMIALGFWAALALLTVRANGIPPFQLLALNTAVAFVGGFALLAIQGRQALAKLRQPLAPWLLSFMAIFLYHALYFYALAAVPPARASLIAFFWPLLIVVFAGLVPSGGGLQSRHLVGALMGLAGVALIFVERGEEIDMQIKPLGYLAAAGCAVIWAGYSVMNRRYAAVPSEMLVGTCAAVAIVSGLAHLVFEQTVTPTPTQWGAAVLLGLGPVGLAFLAWDHATKHGNLSLLGTLAYLTPVVSTALLILVGIAAPTIWLGLGAVLVMAGAVLASRSKQPRMADDNRGSGRPS